MVHMRFTASLYRMIERWFISMRRDHASRDHVEKQLQMREAYEDEMSHMQDAHETEIAHWADEKAKVEALATEREAEIEKLRASLVQQKQATSVQEATQEELVGQVQSLEAKLMEKRAEVEVLEAQMASINERTGTQHIRPCACTCLSVLV